MQLVPLRLACLLAGLACAFPARSETIEEAVARALATFPEIRTAAANRRAIGETLNQARSQRLPSLDANFGYGRERSENSVTRATAGGQTSLDRSEAEITLSQLLFDGGGVSSQIRRQEALADSATLQLESVAEQLALRVAQAYLEVLRLRSALGIARENVGAHDRTLSQVEIIVESGAGRRADARQSTARLAQAESSMVSVQGQLDQSEAAFRHLTGRFPTDLAEPAAPDKSAPISLRDALDAALAQHPSVRAAEQELQAAHAEVGLARARFYPRVTLELGMSRNRDVDGIRGPNADQTAMLRLRQNLYRGEADLSRTREAEARRDEAQARLARAQNDVEREVRQAWDNLAAERQRLPRLVTHARAAGEVVEAYRAQFRIGQRSLIDVLNAETEHFTARSSEVTGRYSVVAGVYRLLASMGKLLAATGVALPQAHAETPSGMDK